MPDLILASASPRRIQLLRAAGFEPLVEPADIDEDDVPPDATPADVAGQLAIGKASSIAQRHPHAVVIGADTVVDLDGQQLGKAATPEAAREMIRLQAGRSQRVHTGIAICLPDASILAEVVTSEVWMRPMSNEEIAAYVATGDWQGKAGAYGIQDERNDPFVRLIAGPFSNVVGLPIERVVELLATVGVQPSPVTQQ